MLVSFMSMLVHVLEKRGRPKTKDGKIDMKNLDLTRLEKMEMKDIEGLVRFSKISRAYRVLLLSTLLNY